MRSIFLTMIVMAVCSTSALAQSKNKNFEEAKKEIAAANAAHFKLYARHDGSITDLYTDDACLFPPNAELICGRDAIDKHFKKVYETGPVRDGKAVTTHIYGNGEEVVTEEGTWEIFDGAGKKVDNGKFIVIWKKTPKGWKMHRDIFSSNNPAKS